MQGAPLRLFFGCFPDAETKDRLAELAREISAEVGGRPTRPARLHLTLVYLGKTHPARLDELCNIGRDLQTRAFVLRCAKVSWWRHHAIAHLALEPSPALLALQASLATALEAQGLLAATERFTPHVTLVRGASRRPTVAMTAFAWPIAEITLVHSVLGPGVPRYERLASFALAAG